MKKLYISFVCTFTFLFFYTSSYACFNYSKDYSKKMHKLRFRKGFKKRTKKRLKTISRFLLNAVKVVYMPRHNCKPLPILKKGTFRFGKRIVQDIRVQHLQRKKNKTIIKCHYTMAFYWNVAVFYGVGKRDCTFYKKDKIIGDRKIRCRLIGAYASLSPKHIQILSYEGYASLFTSSSRCLAHLRSKDKGKK